MDAATILVVDDEQPIVDLVASYLAAEGFAVQRAYDGPSALTLARAFRPDLVVLDVMLPGLDGIEVCRRLHQETAVYVLMLTARADEVDKLIGLSVGADDYLTKPFSPRELVARVKAILRRNRGPAGKSNDRPALIFGALSIDPERREVQRGDLLVELTPREFDLLYALASYPGRVFTREELLQRVWGPDFAGIDRVVDVHVGTLRRKLEDDQAESSFVQTVRGVGYKFVGGPR
ncbi:response regulator transcription factor [Oscillochloris sp. ZM17-4]|uniref:response regulator transcription factor n=1 Tax=Oscillochloris sp. ZM17-4 TaxID=2866714 RepID=UPI001C733CC0|nr:response regulator transcription factor [Oscillochloris sp. ZM17-4]MBX0330663.1 response regulator transcription factor [Oscillochloris sp. ZM17-4]